MIGSGISPTIVFSCIEVTQEAFQIKGFYLVLLFMDAWEMGKYEVFLEERGHDPLPNLVVKIPIVETTEQTLAAHLRKSKHSPRPGPAKVSAWIATTTAPQVPCPRTSCTPAVYREVTGAEPG